MTKSLKSQAGHKKGKDGADEFIGPVCVNMRVYTAKLKSTAAEMKTKKEFFANLTDVKEVKGCSIVDRQAISFKRVKKLSGKKKIYIAKNCLTGRKHLKKSLPDHSFTNDIYKADIVVVKDEYYVSMKDILSIPAGLSLEEDYYAYYSKRKIILDKRENKAYVVNGFGYYNHYSNTFTNSNDITKNKIIAKYDKTKPFPKDCIFESDLANDIIVGDKNLDIDKILRQIHSSDKSSAKMALKMLMRGDNSEYLLYQIYAQLFTPKVGINRSIIECRTFKTKYRSVIEKVENRRDRNRLRHSFTINKNIFIIDKIISYAKANNLDYEDFFRKISPFIEKIKVPALESLSLDFFISLPTKPAEEKESSFIL